MSQNRSRNDNPAATQCTDVVSMRFAQPQDLLHFQQKRERLFLEQAGMESCLSVSFGIEAAQRTQTRRQ